MMAKFLKGKVKNIKSLNISQRVPHVGWNNCDITQQSILFDNITQNANFYFTHSFTPVNVQEKYIISTVEYGKKLVVAVQNNNILGVQFHPEKSQKVGLQILNNFVKNFNA